MTFIHLSLLSLGSLCVAIPVAIHLLMRRRPRHQIFPALRFITEQRQANQRRLRLRHWLLLALRCGAIASFAAALARPTIAAAAFGDWAVFSGLMAAAIGTVGLTVFAWQKQTGVVAISALAAIAMGLLVGCVIMLVRFQQHGAGAMLGSQEAPVSALLIFDTSPRMLYQEGNETRLELAQELARWLLSQLPDDSEVGIMGTDHALASFALDRTLALQSVDSLQIRNHAETLPSAIVRGRELLKTARHARREVYLFSDLSRASWRTELDRATTEFDEADRVLVHVLDVGSLNSRNTSIGDIELSQESLAKGSALTLRTSVIAEGSGGEWMIELWLEDQDPRRPVIVDGTPLLPEKKLRGQQTVHVTPESPQPIEFNLANLAPGTHHGQVELRGHDGLDVDNIRYFTVNVTDAWPVLVVAPTGTVTRYLTDALAPLRLRETGQARYRCDVIAPAELAEMDLTAYRVVALLDPPPLPQRQWRQLTEFTQLGGGVGMFLGREVHNIREFSNVAAEDLLPAAPRRQWNAPEESDIFLSLRDTSHPMLRFFQPIKDSLSWNQFPIYRHWSLGTLTPDSIVVMRYSNDQPAIIERVVGTGRVVVMTTPISDPLNVVDRPAWNVLPTDMDPAFFMLVNEMFEYLAGADRNPLNYSAGEPAGIVIKQTDETARFQLFTPSGNWQDISRDDDRITVSFTDPIGTYRLRADKVRDQTWGFSVNLPAPETDLQRLDPKSLDEILGTNRFHLARDRNEINRGIVEARMGRELYPWLVTLTAILLAIELLMANRFYRETVERESVR